MDPTKAIMVYKISSNRESFVSTAFTHKDALALKKKVDEDPFAQFVIFRAVGGKEIYRSRVIKENRSR